MNKTTVRKNGGPLPELAGTGTETTITVLNPDKKNICTEMFHDIPVRIVRHSKGAMIPVADIASAIDYDRTGLIRIINRNKDLFDEYKGLVILSTPSGAQEMICLTRDGVIGLFLAIEQNRIKDRIKKQRILEYRKWAIETLGKVMDGIPVQPQRVALPAPPLILDVLMENIEVCKVLKKYSKTDPTVIAFALAKTQKETGRDLSGFREMITASHDDNLQDVASAFISDCCIMTGMISRVQFYEEYYAWCSRRMINPSSNQVVNKALRVRNVSETTHKGIRYWAGISLKSGITPLRG